MSGIATAIIGSAVVGGGIAASTGKKSAKAIKAGAQSAADATVQSTEMQVAEIRRQFDYQAEVLYPRLQQQYAASGAFGDLMGIGRDNAAGSANYDPGRSTPVYNSSGNQVGGSGSYAPSGGGRIPPGARTGGETPSYGGSNYLAQPAGAASGMRTDQQGNYIDSSGYSIDPYQSGFITPDQEQELRQINAQRAASGQPPMTPFDYGVQTGTVDPSNVQGGGRTGMVSNNGGVRAGQPVPQAPGPNATTFQRGSRGQFQDPNVDPLALSDAEGLTGQVRNSLLAPGGFDTDVYGSFVDRNRNAAGTVGESNMFRRSQDVTASGAFGDRQLYDPNNPSARQTFAQSNQIFGQDFEQGPGYNFMVEEMQREVDRKNSAGGNYGGRALMEAERRSKGLAAGEFYNWAAGRDRDLSRQERAYDEDYNRQATDIGRMDQANLIDIGRGDEATQFYENQRATDLGRGDRAMENYLGQREGDVTRMDRAVGEQDRLRGVDLQREDAAYQNYLANLRAQAGFGDVSSQVVNASQGAASGVANAYGNQGNQQAAIFQNQGTNLANTYANTGANVSNAIQSGIQNYSTYNYLKNNPGTAVNVGGYP